MASLLVFLFWVDREPAASIALGGDVMLARAAVPLISDAAAFGDALPLLRKADFAVANLESPLAATVPARSGSGEYDLCALSSSALILQDAGLDAVSIENNHDQDCGASGQGETQKWLANAGITAVSSENSAFLLTAGDQKIALLAYEDVTQPLDLDQVLLEVSRAKKSSDFLILSLHWGNEYQAGPDAGQKIMAQKLADAGVDVIWGHHPHVLQRMEWVKSSKSSHKTLVIYSLGNLISDQRMFDDAQRTAIITLQVRQGEISEISVTPLVMNMTQNRLQKADPDQQKLIDDRLKWNPNFGRGFGLK